MSDRSLLLVSLLVSSRMKAFGCRSFLTLPALLNHSVSAHMGHLSESAEFTQWKSHGY